MIVALEGIRDASGKATQSLLLAARLNAALFSFPRYETATGQAVGMMLRGEMIIGDPAGEPNGPPYYINALVRQALFTVNRYEVATEIEATAKSGDVVLDRYWPSAVVYGAVDGLPVDWLVRIHDSLPPADLHILIDIDVEDSVRRRPERRDSYERDLDGSRRRCAEYLSLWRLESAKPSGWFRWRVVNGRASIEEVSREIDNCISAWRSSR